MNSAVRGADPAPDINEFSGASVEIIIAAVITAVGTVAAAWIGRRGRGHDGTDKGQPSA
ncbi:hypothetical protein GCM10010383_78910 [Streptomyces lomondensis]|uniref:Uncharacterized protein n=1 Tax=Streptomyces lomondensis TaxID=68229 RepID=A0ABQ2XW63_9ACTN|nr:hypothetical protein GCM10010383_78910 [Streptomyces lomondensis]